MDLVTKVALGVALGLLLLLAVAAALDARDLQRQCEASGSASYAPYLSGEEWCRQGGDP